MLYAYSRQRGRTVSVTARRYGARRVAVLYIQQRVAIDSLMVAVHTAGWCRVDSGALSASGVVLYKCIILFLVLKGEKGLLQFSTTTTIHFNDLHLHHYISTHLQFPPIILLLKILLAFLQCFFNIIIMLFQKLFRKF